MSRITGKLQTAQLPIVSHAACQNALSGPNLDRGGENKVPEGPTPVVSDAMLCAGSADAGGVDGAASICKGDASGPLAVNGQVVGIASWDGVSCDTATGSPSVCTSVTKYKSWIEGR